MPNRKETDRNIRFQNQPTTLDPRFKIIEDLITVKPHGQPSGFLNKNGFEKILCLSDQFTEIYLCLSIENVNF